MTKSTSVSSGSFPTMGTSAAASVTPLMPIKGRSAKKSGEVKGGFLEAATASHRPQIQERLGAKLHPTATLYAANAAEAGMTQRNVRILPSAAGVRDFYLRRQYGQGV